MKRPYIVGLCLLLGGCASMNRSCSSWNANQFGSDWIVVQNDASMNPKRCWKLSDTSITNEAQSDGIYWLDPVTGHLVHISGWYNRVQVKNRQWAGAAKSLGVDINKCGDGIYG